MIDISEKLGKKVKEIKISESEIYAVDDSANTFLEIFNEMQKGFTVETMYWVIEKTLGTPALESIKSKNLNVKGLEMIVIAISACIQEVSFEEMEKRFQRDVK